MVEHCGSAVAQWRRPGLLVVAWVYQYPYPYGTTPVPPKGNRMAKCTKYRNQFTNLKARVCTAGAACMVYTGKQS